MGQLVIVTESNYLICESIYHVTLDCVDTDNELVSAINNAMKLQRKLKVKPTKLQTSVNKAKERARYKITINYAPVPVSQNTGRIDTRECDIVIYGFSNASRIFRDIVEQIREQMPDQLYLNKLVDKLLGDNND